MEFLDNIKIDKLSDFLGNYQQKKTFKTFLESTSETFALIIGANGVGKTTFVMAGINEKELKCIRPDYDQFNTHKDFVNYISSFTNTSFISNSLKIDKDPKIIFIDDINILISQNRYGLVYIEELCDKLSKQNQTKLIVSINIEDEKKISDLKKNKHILIKLNNPPINECLSFILDHLDKNGYEVEEELLFDIIKVHNCNLRSIFTNLVNEDYCKEDNDVYQDKNIFDIIETLFKRSENNINDIEIGISSDPTLISLIMYDNYKDYYFHYFKNNKKTIDNGFSFVNKNYVDASIMESEAYKNNDQMLIDWANLIKCASIRFVYNSSIRKITPKTDIHMKYTTILSRLSQYFSNVKKQNKYNGEYDINVSNSMTLWSIYYLSDLNNKKLKKKSKKQDELKLPKGQATVFYNAFTKLYAK